MQSPGWQLTLCVAWCLIWWFTSLDKYGHTWHWMFLLRPGVIKQHKPNQTWLWYSNERLSLSLLNQIWTIDVFTFWFFSRTWSFQKPWSLHWKRKASSSPVPYRSKAYPLCKSAIKFSSILLCALVKLCTDMIKVLSLWMIWQDATRCLVFTMPVVIVRVK